MRERLADYLNMLESVKGVSMHTLKAYETDISAFLDYLNEVSGKSIVADEIQPRWIRRYMGRLSEVEKLSATTCARKLSALKGYFSYLVEEDVLKVSPAESIQGPKRPNHLPEVPPENKLKQLLNFLAEQSEVESVRDAALIELIYGCGLRLSEAISLDTKDINLRKHWIRVLGKRSKYRDIPLTQSTISAFERWLNSRSEYIGDTDDGALFLGKRGKRLNLV